MRLDVGYTKDFLNPDGKLQFRSIGQEILKKSHHSIRTRFLSGQASPLTPDLLRDLDVVVSLTPRYDINSLAGVERLIAIVRFGVGYDMVDVEACTNANIALCITRGAVDHSVAEAVIGWMLQLGHRSAAKDRLVREGRWPERDQCMGRELRGKTLGIIGLGGIGAKVAKFARALEMKRVLVFDPYLKKPTAVTSRVESVSLDSLMKESDYISVHCPLTQETRNLIGSRQLRLMKSSAYLINTARGGIVNESALYQILKKRKIAGAAVDVFETEPADASIRLAELDNILLAPHCIAWTDDLFAEIGTAASSCILDIAQGKVPRNVVNPEVLKKTVFKRKLARFKL